MELITLGAYVCAAIMVLTAILAMHEGFKRRFGMYVLYICLFAASCWGYLQLAEKAGF